MLARSVKRPEAEIRLIEGNYRDRGPPGNCFARSNAQQGISPAQAKERMRFLPADRGEFSFAELTAHVMRPVAVIIQVTFKRGWQMRQRKLLAARPH